MGHWTRVLDGGVAWLRPAVGKEVRLACWTGVYPDWAGGFTMLTK